MFLRAILALYLQLYLGPVFLCIKDCLIALTRLTASSWLLSENTTKRMTTISRCSIVEGKVLVIADTLLATGASIEVTYNKLCESGMPLHTHLVCPVASVYAVEHLKKYMPDDKVTLWTAAIDEELTSKSYIVPGIGDAGDLSYGDKL